MNREQAAPEPPIRKCVPCRAEDDHPRVLVMRDLGDPSKDEHYHIDCLPEQYFDQHVHGPMLKLREQGHRGDELRAAVLDAREKIERDREHAETRAREKAS